MNCIVVISAMFMFSSLHGMQEITRSHECIKFSTLKRKCLDIVIKQALAKDPSLPQDLIESLEAFKKLHSLQDNCLIQAFKKLCFSPVDSLSNDIRTAFKLCAPYSLKEKVEHINKKK